MSTATTTAPAAPAGTQHSRPAATAAKPKAGPARRVIPAMVALAALGFGGRYAYQAYVNEDTDDAYIVAHQHRVGPQVDGVVLEVLAKENQEVKAGDVLVRLDPLQFQIGVEQARAALAVAQAAETQAAAALPVIDAQIEETRARVAQARGEVSGTRSQLELARLTLSRSEQLLKSGGATTVAELDSARTAESSAAAAVQAAESGLAAAEAAVRGAEAGRTAAVAQQAGAKAGVAAAQAALHEAERKLAATVLTAPSAGRIGNKLVEPGNRVQSGQVLLALFEPNPWIVANFKETQLAHVQVGQAVEIQVDAVPGASLHGRIDSIAPASGAQYALLPPDNATGNFNKVVQRIPVRIELDPESRQLAGDRLRAGFSTLVTVRVR
jgi:membrane fusion protein (multidrug efflux system)